MTNFEGMCTRLFAHRFCQLTCLVYLSLALPAVALAQTSAPTTVPAPHSADAKEAINKGILAARQQDYPLAIRYFQDARKIAPDAPEIYFDLGLAELKDSGTRVARHRMVRRVSGGQSKCVERSGGERSDSRARCEEPK